MKGMNPNLKVRLLKTKEILTKIDNLLNDLEKVDPYGDIVENFCDVQKRRQTKRLLAMVNAQLNGKDPYEAEDKWDREATK